MYFYPTIVMHTMFIFQNHGSKVIYPWMDADTREALIEQRCLLYKKAGMCFVYRLWLIIKARKRLLWKRKPYKLGSYIINYFFIFTGECFSGLQFFSFSKGGIVNCSGNNNNLLWLFMQIYLSFVIQKCTKEIILMKKLWFESDPQN